MTPDEISEAKSLVAMPGWAWAPGMRPRVLLESGHTRAAASWIGTAAAAESFDNADYFIPDTDNLPTRYALLGIVRRVPGWARACVLIYDDDGHGDHCVVMEAPPDLGTYGDEIANAPTESLALIRAATRALEELNR